MKTAADFNKEQEEKKKAEAVKNVPETEKVIVKTKDGKHICANKGCSKRSFDPQKDEDLKEDACNYHCGEAIFHDLKKFWSCCKDTVTYDWDDFMKIPTCSVGPH